MAYLAIPGVLKTRRENRRIAPVSSPFHALPLLMGAAGYVVNAAILAFDTDQFWDQDFETGIAFSILISPCASPWAGNRYLTFAASRTPRTVSGAFQSEWLKFMGANLVVGSAVNYGTSVLLVHYAPHPLSYKYVAQACGVLAGLLFNFTLSKKLVFKAPL